MSKKVPLGITLSLIVVAITVTFAITMAVSQKVYNGLITDLPQRTEMYSSLSKVDELIRSHYYGSIDEDILNVRISDGYVNGLNDKYSYYMDADEYSEYETVLSGKSSGIGITPALDKDTGFIAVAEVFKDSPAETSGLKKGDLITAIGKDDVLESTYEDMIGRLKGRKLTTVDITYKRGDESKTINVMKGYNAQSVSHKLIGKVGYIKINAFYANTKTQTQAALESLKKSGAQSLIFDLRNTDKGSIEYTAQVLDLLVPVPDVSDGGDTDVKGGMPTGAVATAVDKNGKSIRVFSSDSIAESLQMLVLVNSKTCGGAELFACDLRDFGKAWIVGNKTLGNGTMQQVFRLDDGGAIMLTVAKIFPYKSESYDGVGLNPDHEVSLTDEQAASLDLLPESDDTQLQAALSLLSGTTAPTSNAPASR